MSDYTATAQASPNIAFLKYWGNRDERLRLPVNGSISMNLAGLHARTTVHFGDGMEADALSINGKEISGGGLQRVSAILDEVRTAAGFHLRGEIRSESNFPTGAGIASSAAAFAALAVAATKAAGLDWSEAQLSRLARHGSGSACRSIPSGFVEWVMGTGDDDSFAHSIADPEHWALTDCVAVVSTGHKAIGSTEGHGLAPTSPLQVARVQDANRRLEICRLSILARDFDGFGAIIEQDSNIMHAVMMTSNPALFYWQPATLTVMNAVREWRAAGIPAAYTIDAGPNVHVLCPQEHAATITAKLRDLPGVLDVLTANVGGAARQV